MVVSRPALKHGWVIPPIIALLFILLGPSIFGVHDQQQILLVAIYTLIVLGLNLSFGFGGELAFGQVAIFAVGAYTTAILHSYGHTDLLLAGMVAILAAAVVGFVSGIPGMRLSHHTLALTSFFLVLVLPDVIAIFDMYTGGQTGLSGIIFPTVLGQTLDTDGFFIFVIATCFVAIVCIRNLVLSHHGEALSVLRESPLLAESLGLSVYRLRIFAYVVGGLPAGVAGVLWAYLSGFVYPDTFLLSTSIAILAASVVGGSRSIYGAAIGSALLIFGPLQASAAQEYSLLIYGVFLVVVAVVARAGLAGLGWTAMTRVLRRLPATLTQPGETLDEGYDSASSPGERLVVEGVTKAFGGLQALQGVNLAAEPGQITAILGANGAGKSTLLNAVSCFVRADSGRILVGGEEIQSLRPHRAARLGIGRTFQTPLIPEELTALEVVRTGRLHMRRAGPLATLLRLSNFRRIRRDDTQAALAALAFAGLLHHADQEARSLPLGTRRLLEVVRAFAGQPSVVLLDEPAAGLDDTGLRDLAELLVRFRDAGATVVLVEHNVPFVLGFANAVHVMGLGKVIASGTPDEIRNDPEVIASYLGNRTAPVPAAESATIPPADESDHV
ncbi:branched-chain amino acid ABC transporter ATP-binding protein/permease [Arthrobacter sp. BE255]|uniref:branched-chain amino acid ABC transporter ATP-binding protein/permease n=1 Tax=Arthrobacter sp. BE255 TaxID=2817721 RepID=UPI002857A1A9|nr:branched-chain amino acid ABC transporter ATP-binding protein/permease [Arthrobacter sp. BE255]MDR7159132.1 branched-chain amino acid transport system permease protein [Arthrobacter sp. BE255]